MLTEKTEARSNIKMEIKHIGNTAILQGNLETSKNTYNKSPKQISCFINIENGFGSLVPLSYYLNVTQKTSIKSVEYFQI